MVDKESPFYRMSITISSKQAWHQGRRMLYDGSHKAKMVSIVKDKRVSRFASQSLDWARLGVDYLVSDCVFDAFQRDEFGATRLLVECGGDQAILSAITNSAVGAVSFIAIIPRDGELPILVPFSGAEATGIKTARGNELDYGLAVKSRENGIVTQWYFFERGAISVLSDSGDVLDTVDLGTDSMPFIQFTYDPDSASDPFGKSRISRAAIGHIDTALRNMSLEEQVALINLLKGDLLLVNGQPEGLKSQEEFKAAVGTLRMLFFDGLDLDGIKLEQLQQIELSTVSDSIDRATRNFASSMDMDPTVFGLQPTNGSFSEGTLKRMQRSYANTKARARNSYGASIELLAIELYKIVSQTNDVDGVMDIQTVFREEVNVDNMGAIGDAFMKLTASLKEVASGIQIPEEYVREVIGLPLRPMVINDDLPNFEASREKFREVKLDGIGGGLLDDVSGAIGI